MKNGIYIILDGHTDDMLCDIIDKEIYPILTEKIVKNL